MKVTIMPIVIGAFSTVSKGLLKGLKDLRIRGRVETIKITTLLRTARIVRRVLETCCHSNSSERPSANADVKNSQRVKKKKIYIYIIIIIIIRRRRRRRGQGGDFVIAQLYQSNIFHWNFE